MKRSKRLFVHALVLIAVLSFSYTSATAQDSGFKQIAQHLKTRYQAKKKSIPFLGLAKFAVKLVKPAGVKSFSLSIFENLKNTNDLPDSELSMLMRNALSQEWQPLVRVRSRNGDQVYVYAMDAGKDVKLAVLVINQREAAIARVKIDPQALRKFVENPKILGISLSDKEGEARNDTPQSEREEKSTGNNSQQSP